MCRVCWTGVCMSISFFLSCVTLREVFSLTLKPLCPGCDRDVHISALLSACEDYTRKSEENLSWAFYVPGLLHEETQIIETSRPISFWMRWVCWMAWGGETLLSSVVAPDEKQSKSHHLIDRRCSSFLPRSVWWEQQAPEPCCPCCAHWHQ